MDFLFKKEKTFAEAVERYLDQVRQCNESFRKAIAGCFGDSFDENFQTCVNEVNVKESKADVLRRETQHQLYEGAMLPHARGDYWRLLEKLDKIPNKMELVVNNIYLMNIPLPETYRESTEKLTDAIYAGVMKICDSVSLLFSDLQQALHAAIAVREYEAAADNVERNLIKAIFVEEIELSRKLLYKEIINGLGSIIDNAENVSDRISIVAIKRKA
ncbi:MAG: DUF47 family protein [Chitinivibrionales bacterium]|nr:DUF47 family protein [Chitinivibrionales bacterium]